MYSKYNVTTMTDITCADELNLLRTQRNIKRSASWFYWIAVLSIINSLTVALSGKSNFAVELGITKFMGGIALATTESGTGHSVNYIVIGISALAAGVFALCGVAGVKHALPIYVIGMVLYAMDALIYFESQSWIPVAFHVFVLINLWKTVSMTKEYQQIEQWLKN